VTAFVFEKTEKQPTLICINCVVLDNCHSEVTEAHLPST
jgi:hypothetical protein